MKHQFEGKVRKVKAPVTRPTRKEVEKLARRYKASLSNAYTVAGRDDSGRFAHIHA